MKNPLEEYLKEKTAADPWREAAEFAKGLGPNNKNLQDIARHIGNSQARQAASSVLRPSIGQQFMGAAGNAAMAAAGAGAVTLAGMAAQKLYDAATKAQDFKAMLSFDAGLAAKHQEDPRLVNQMFSTLRTFNPSFTKDPAVASSLVARMVDSPGGVSGMMGEVLPLRDKMRGQIGPAMMQSALGGIKGKGKERSEE